MSLDPDKSRNRTLGPLFPTIDIFYGWWLVGVAAFLLTLMSLTVFQGLGTILVALERQFG